MMKRYLLLSALILAAISCAKDEYIGVQKSSFPGVIDEIGKIEVETIFSQDHLDLDIVIPSSLSAGYAEAFDKIKGISKTDGQNIVHSAYVYEQQPTSAGSLAIPEGNISVIINPDVKAIASMLKNSGFDYDISGHEGCALIALSDMGSFFVIDQFLENDVLGTLNGLVKWLNGYVEMRNRLSSETSEGTQPDAETLFSSFNSGYTFTFDMPKQEVAAVACSDKDYISGSGTVDVLYKITPLHAFDDQQGHGDYYIVNASTAFNSAGMYKGRYVSKHGGVYVRICGAFAREFAIESFISGKDGNPIGQYVAGAMPHPSTTIGKTSYTSGLTWNIGSTLTGGIAGGKLESGLSLNGGISVSNTHTREVSDVDILLDQATNKASYTYKFNKAPEYQSGSITISDPTEISTHTATFEHSYIIYLPDIKDGSSETHKMNVKITRLNYGACRFYSTCADFKNYTWGLDKMNTAIASKSGGANIPLPNRLPTGKLKITHDDVSYGKYIFEVKAVSVDDPSKVHEFTGSSYAKGDSFTANLPTGKYNVTLKIGDKTASTVEVKSALVVNIVRAEETKLNSGADFSK